MRRRCGDFARGTSNYVTVRAQVLAIASLAAVLATACSPSAPRKPPGVPPAPVTVTREEPGGDAADPHLAALARLTRQPWGWRNDRQDALHLPMPDWANWRRVTFWGVPTFAGYRYGDGHHAVLGVWVREATAEESATSEACLDAFERWGEGSLRVFGVEVGPRSQTEARWQRGKATVRSLDARLDTLLSSRAWAAAYAAYVMWPGTCTVYGVAVPLGDDAADEAAARAVRDRFVREGFARMDQHMAARPAL